MTRELTGPQVTSAPGTSAPGTSARTSGPGAGALHVLFQVDGATYAVPADVVLQLESFVGATRVPGAPAHVRGLVQVRGRVVPVVDVRGRFSLPAAVPTQDSRVLVVEQAGRVVALLVDAAREVVRLDGAAVAPPPDIVAQERGRFVRGVGTFGERMVLHLDIGSLVGPEKIHD